MGKNGKGKKRRRSEPIKSSTDDNCVEEKEEEGKEISTTTTTDNNTSSSATANTVNTCTTANTNTKTSSDVDVDANNVKVVDVTTKERKDLGLTVSIELLDEEDIKSSTAVATTTALVSNDKEEMISISQHVPNPYRRSCLDDNDDTSNGTGTGTDNPTLQLVKHAFQKISKQKYNSSSKWSPTPIQLQSWPILVPTLTHLPASISKQQTAMNIIGISPTGSGKSLGYVIPLVQRASLSFIMTSKNNSNSRRKVFGLIVTPTRELTIQVSKVVKSVAKSANQLLAKNKKNKMGTNTKTKNNDIVVSSLAIYGGIDKSEQIQALIGKKDDNNNNIESYNNIIVTATPGRLIDLMGISVGDTSSSKLADESSPKKDTDEKRNITNSNNKKDNTNHINDNDNDDSNTKTIQNLFQSIEMFIIDEADRVATQSDISKQVDIILNFIKKKKVGNTNNNVDEIIDNHEGKEKEIIVGLFSATLPQKALLKIDDWIPRPRVLVKVNSLTVGGNSSSSNSSGGGSENNVKQIPSEEGSTNKNNESSLSSTEKKTKERGILNLSAIPSHVEQILHVCSNHKKPKKLMSTIQKIRENETKNNQRRRKGLIIVFFGRVKTLQYIHDLIQKENIQSVQLHSQMRQERRESQLNLFRSGKNPIMLATDIAARGLHVNNVEYIINYDFPGSLEQYVHRCGRAGRNKVSNELHNNDKKVNSKDASESPKVYSFFHRELKAMAKDVVELLRSCNAYVDPNLLSLVPAKDRLNDEPSSRSKRRRRNAKKEAVENVEKPKHNNERTESNDFDSDEEEFASLQMNRIVLKRASHVSDAESDSDSDNDE